MEERFDSPNLREEITDYLYNNAVPTHDTIEHMTDDIVDIFVKRLTEFNRRPIYPVNIKKDPYDKWTNMVRYYCPVCGKQQKSKADGDTWYCERCGEKLRMVRNLG